MARLENVESATHVAAGELEESLFAVLSDVAAFGLDDMVESIFDLVEFERVETETGTTRLDGGNDLVDVIADDAEADVLGVLLNDCGGISMRT